MSIQPFQIREDKIKKTFSVLSSKDRRIYLALSDCVFFGETYIKPYDKKWTSRTANFHYELIDSILRFERLQVHVPFEHAKTTWLSIVFPTWRIIKDVNEQILLISATPKLVQKCLAVISWHLLNNKLLLNDFPHLKKNEEIQKWTDLQIYVERDSVSKDPTVEAVGMGGNILGGRYNWILGDDICDRRNMNTKALRDKAEDWWLNDVSSRILEHGHIANQGTLQHSDDLGVRLSKKKTYKYIKKEAIIDEEKGKVLWEDRFPLKRLLKIKEDIGTIAFERGYQNNIESFEGLLLDPDWLKPYYKDYEIKLSDLRIYFGVDPDIAEVGISRIEASKHNWFVIAVLGWDPIKNVVYVLKTYYAVLSFPEQVKQIVKHYEIYNPIKILVEDNFYQKALRQQLYLKGLPVFGVTSTKNKTFRIESRAPDYESGRIRVLESQHELIEEHIHFGDDDYRDDVLDAIDIGMKGIPVRAAERYVDGGVI
ncbi:hypothetical protein ES703_43070 [subsurface metagenome]